MGGYLHDPLADINLIADNLRDRYKSGFPVLKEIIQNADDAGKGDETIQLEVPSYRLFRIRRWSLSCLDLWTSRRI